MDQNEHDNNSPAKTFHLRLEEVHYFWHQCLLNYQDPKLFVFNLNACIQALRNTTFALQKEKNSISNFDAFYGPWQQKMSSDPILKWVKNSRNKIVKQEDLLTNSLLMAHLVLDYNDTAKIVASEYETFLEIKEKIEKEKTSQRHSVLVVNEEIVESFQGYDIPSNILNEATINIERRWEENDLEGHELLGVVGYAFGFLNQVSIALHMHLGIAEQEVIILHEQQVLTKGIQENEGRLPCMITTRELRTSSYNLRDGLLNEGGLNFPVEVDEAAQQKGFERYGQPEITPRISLLTRDNYMDFVVYFEKVARTILASGDDHGLIIFYFREGHLVGQSLLYVRDSADKRSLAAQTADHVARNGINALMLIGESWMAPMPKSDEEFVKPGEHAEKTEAVTIDLELATGEKVSMVIPFERISDPSAGENGTTVVIGETFVLSNSQNNFFEPSRVIWKSKGT